MRQPTRAGGGGILGLNAGISRTVADGRYIKRFVGAVLAGDTYLGTNSTGTEVVLANPNGPVMGGLPLNAAAVLYGADDGVRAINRVRIYGVGADGNLGVERVNGSLQVPTAITSGQFVGQIIGRGYNGTGLFQSSAVAFVARENFTATALGGQVVIRAVNVGGTTVQSLALFRGAANVSEMVGQQVTSRIVPFTAGTYQGRNPTNTGNVVEWGADTLGFYNTAPIVKPTVTGSAVTGAAALSIAAALAALGLVINTTTP